MQDARRAAQLDLERARAALDRGALDDAAGHLAGAIVAAPTLPETHELLSRLAVRAGGALELFPLGRHPFVGTVVARAHLLAAAGQPDDALALLASASGHAPAVDWAGVPWVNDPELGGRLAPQPLAHAIMQLCLAVGEPAPADARAALRPYLTVLRHAVAAHPDEPLLLGAGSALARRVGEAALAVDWAARGAQVRPSHLAEIWLGYAYRSAGRLPEALAALRRALTLDPGNLSVYADIAALLAESGRLEEALVWVDRALAIDPSYDCAVHTAHRLRFHADGDLAHLVALADFQRDHPDDDHEHTELADCCARVPWLGGLPYVPGGGTAPEPVADAAGPGAPDPAAARRLAAVAEPWWAHPPAAYDAAIALVAVPPRQLTALLADPPEPPADGPWPGLDPQLWRRCARAWAALGLLHHGTDEPWPGSRRRELLTGLAASPDARAEAALFALVVQAWVDPQARLDVAVTVARRLDAAAAEGGPVARAVAQLALATPGLDPVSRLMAAGTPADGGRPHRPGGRVRRLLRRWRRAGRRG